MFASSRISVSTIKKSDQLIHCLVEPPGDRRQFFLTFVYDSNSAQERKLLWSELKMISDGVAGPWVLLGDFNAVRTLQK